MGDDDFRAFVSNEGHTVAGMVGAYLQQRVGMRKVAYACVNDPLVEEAGVRIRAPSRAIALGAVDDALALTWAWEEAVRSNVPSQAGAPQE